MKEILKNIPIATILLTYLFICGSLYLIGFWSTFNVDVFSLISLYDIPKNFVFPLLVTQSLFLVNALSSNLIDLEADRVSVDNLIPIKSTWPKWKRVILTLFTSTRLVLATVLISLTHLYDDFLKNPQYWTLTSAIIAYFLLFKFINHSNAKEYIKSGLLRYYIGHLIIFFPIASFSTGKILSLNIYNNDKPTIIEVKVENKLQKLKFLGFISDTYIYSSKDNKIIYIQEKFSDSKIKLIISK